MVSYTRPGVGFWKIFADERDSHKTAILTKCHIRMAQGLCNAAATFQLFMHLVLRGLAWSKVLVHLDAVIVLGKSFEESLENLEIVLQRFEVHHLKLKPKKCSTISTAHKAGPNKMCTQ